MEYNKPRTLEQARKERWQRQIAEARELGRLATQEIDEALCNNVIYMDFSQPPEPTEPPDILA